MNMEVTFQPSGKSVRVSKNTTLLNTARKAGVYIPTRCDGKASCLMCKVHIPVESASFAGEPSEAERRKLGPLLEQGTRLSCQTRVQGTLTVSIPEDPLKAAVRRQLEKQREEDELW